MIKRIVEISRGSWISLKDRQLVVEQDSKVVAKVPIEDLGIDLRCFFSVLLASPARLEISRMDIVSQRPRSDDMSFYEGPASVSVHLFPVVQS